MTFVELLPDLKRFYVRRLAGLSREAVDDLVQETFSRALATTTDIGELDLRTYVFGIAGNIFLDLMRRQYRSGAFVEGLIHETSVAMPSGENDDTWVARWILSKPRDQQEVLVRRVYFEDSQREAAQSLGISYQKLRTMEARLREELKRDLSETPRQQGKAVPNIDFRKLSNAKWPSKPTL